MERSRAGSVLLFAALLAPAPGALAVSPETQEFIALSQRFAAGKCAQVRDYTEMMLVSQFGDAARMKEIEKRGREPQSGQDAAARKRMNELGSRKPTPEESAAIVKAASRNDMLCPWGKESLPPQTLAIPDEAGANDIVLAFVPRTLVKLRQCEIYFPDRRGAVDKAWNGSAFSKLKWPELQAPVNEARAWLKDGLGKPAPGSRLERELADANASRMQAMQCDRFAGDLQRIEAALPPGFLAKKR